MITEEKADRVLLNMIPGIGPRSYRMLLEAFASARDVRNASVRDLARVVQEPLAERIHRFCSAPGLFEEECALIEKHHVHVMTWDDPEYPERIRQCHAPPPVLYVQGEREILAKELMMAIVGTRKPTVYGKQAAADITGQLVERGFGTVSGFALGIDAIAHAVTVERGGATIAVLGCGLLVEYPYAHRDLREKIAGKGAFISEFPLRYPPIAENFPRRNRLIAALGMGTVVIEAGDKSGSLITAVEAVHMGKDVFAVPGSIYSPFSRGTNTLISKGAKIVRHVDDILHEVEASVSREFSFSGDDSRARQDAVRTVGEQEEILFRAIEWEPVTIEYLLEHTDMASYELAKGLIELELKGYIQALPGKRYVRVKQ